MQKSIIQTTLFKSTFFNSHIGAITMAHGPQGTGNYKGKRDRHEKTPHNSAKKEKSWTHIGNKKKK